MVLRKCLTITVFILFVFTCKADDPQIVTAVQHDSVATEQSSVDSNATKTVPSVSKPEDHVVTPLPDIPTAIQPSSVSQGSTTVKDVEPVVPPVTTVKPDPDPTTTIKPGPITTVTTDKPIPTTSSSISTSSSTTTPTKPTPSTALPPTSTTQNTSSTTTKVVSTTLSPEPHRNREFDGPSFIGGIVLASGLMAIGFVAFKFYKARTERNYHTL